MLTVTEFISVTSMAGMAIAWAWREKSGRRIAKGTEDKLRIENLEAIIVRQEKEIDRQVKNNENSDAAKLKLIDFNKELLMRDDASNKKIEMLSAQLQTVKNQLQLICFKLGIPVPRTDEDFIGHEH